MEQHCSEEILSAYLDGDLEAEAAGTTAEHLAECEVCRQTLAQVRSIRDAAPGMEQLLPPDRVWGAIQERVHGSRSRSRQLSRLFWVGVPALAAAVLVVVLVGRAHVRSLPGRGGAVAASDLSVNNATEETAREYGEYVRGIDRAIDECRVALAENPGNVRVRAAYSGATIDRRRVVDRLASGGE